MKLLGISKQIILVAIFPALIVSILLSTHFIHDQFNHITKTLHHHGSLITKQILPAAEYAIYSGNINLIKPLVNTIIKNNPVIRVQIFDKYDIVILDIKSRQNIEPAGHPILERFLTKDTKIKFIEPILVVQVPIDDNESISQSTSTDNNNIYIGQIVVTLTTQNATQEKITQIKSGTLITMIILLLTIMVIIPISNAITRPIKSLTHTVKNIAAGNLEAKIDNNASGEVGILQSCVNHMAEELKRSQSDMEGQLNNYTLELQQTMEELEIRNAELDITRSKAIYANNAKSEFLANMSHEIRTPLSGIIGFTELLQDTSLTAQQDDYSNTIHKSSIILLELINDILDLSKIESGKIEISSCKFNLTDIIEDIINLLSQTALDKNIELFYRIEKDVPVIIHTDSFRIHQILTNLIGNAIKFTDKGYVYLQVTMGELEDTESSIKLTVSDTGIGMSNDVKTKLFKAFTQADTSITRRFGGTGLGLVISRKLTLLMHGEIGFDSTAGEGSTFWFTVPVTPIPQEPEISELSGKNIAFICNHFIAKQSFKSLFNHWDCNISDYVLDDLLDKRTTQKINQSFDMVVVLISNKDLNQDATAIILDQSYFAIPSLLLVSTQSHTRLKTLQQQTFNGAAFTSEKSEAIKQKLLTILDRSSKAAIAEFKGNDMKLELDWSSINILIVDDNEINLRLVEIILHKHKARVTTARSGAQAIEYSGMNAYDIIFMDLHMPGLDGYDTTKQIREISPSKQPVIIALTANAMPQEEEQAMQSGMNGIIIKPANEVVLRKVIKQWVFKEPTDAEDKNIFNSSNNACSKRNPVFSLELAKEFTGDNEELAYELFSMLRSELDSYKKHISDAVNNSNMKELHAHLHKLNGASRCCGTSELKDISSRIENMIINNINFDVETEIKQLFTAIQNVADYKIENVPM